VDHTFRKGDGGFPKGQAGGIASRDATEQVLEPVGATDPLQVPDQGKGTILLTTPSELLITFEAHLESHRAAFAGEIAQGATPHRLEAEAGERFSQTVRIPEDRWQDGEMGQGDDARCTRT
jgi:hypothetical protein